MHLHFFLLGREKRSQLENWMPNIPINTISCFFLLGLDVFRNVQILETVWQDIENIQRKCYQGDLIQLIYTKINT